MSNGMSWLELTIFSSQDDKPMPISTDPYDAQLFHPAPSYPSSYPGARPQAVSGKEIGIDPGVLGGFHNVSTGAHVADDAETDPASPALRPISPHETIPDPPGVRRSSRPKLRPRSDSYLNKLRQSSNKSILEEDEDHDDDDDDDKIMRDEADSPERLEPIDMADEDELEQLRLLEMGGPAMKKDKRRLQNKLAQRSFRARSRIVRREAANHLADVEVKTVNQMEELKLLRIMVENLRKENLELKRRFSEDFPMPSPTISKSGSGRKRKASGP
ncbi:hypothetical protein BD324DRAFT_475854 [Kockovaella imperatae]|uniref:BZIP domain-containing protein n=1 Tax=Kockovaella imperatae TaxID=4999 RepID=A0A1Y1UH74_9TREE|nr:hypothetical protein BD324DRAFT_475854 [Kockovaella imperatae]ORX36877.1 hypothetical protein BD324DRAFT_475854 [Kockovaella imperatae]